MRLLALLAISLGLATGAKAQEIHKCTGGDTVAYQSAPCEAGSVDEGLLRLPDYADPPQRDAATAPPMESADALPATEDTRATQSVFPFRRTISLGLTDDQVLNLPGWGRPDRITRTGRHRGWREIWTYGHTDGVQQLSFTSGRLTAIENESG